MDIVNEEDEVQKEETKPEKTEFVKGDLFYDADGEAAPELPDICKLMDNDNWNMAGEEDMMMDEIPDEELNVKSESVESDHLEEWISTDRVKEDEKSDIEMESQENVNESKNDTEPKHKLPSYEDNDDVQVVNIDEPKLIPYKPRAAYTRPISDTRDWDR